MTQSITELENLSAVEMDAGSVFSGRASGTKIMAYSSPSTFTPATNPNYLFPDQSGDLIVWSLDNHDPLYIFGPQGSGKSCLVKELASRLNYPVFELTGHSRLEFPELAGHLSVKDGQMFFQYGPLSLAMKFGGLFLLNEIDLLDPSTAAVLNWILDGFPLCIPENGGELITPSPMFRFAATANTNGSSDETGLCHGTLRQNSAFVDRFWLCETGYPKADREVAPLAKIAPALPSALLSKMVEFASEVRKLFRGSGSESRAENLLDVAFSTRTLIRWARLAIKFRPPVKQGVSPINYALDRTLAFRASSESEAFLHELSQRFFNAESAGHN
ncbi:MAG: CbbQ/NirQ/NorQ/GpvN family protein [Deltaproteobacteria bacterium]|jgi:cobaltochelatase CobS|nr:CbbQ/NirQ/NorQ/GpvN family protein [Deltaproteobacteria bacterium]